MTKSGKVLLGIFLLAVTLRLWFVSGKNVMFWFDQSRDAFVVQSILHGDLKIQGPTAGGTDDVIFHGVLYYYLLTPLYWLGNGNPQFVSYGLAIFSSLSVLIAYFMTRDILKKESMALLAAFLVAVSAVHIQEGVWLSNPVIMIVSLPLFFWMLWKIFWSGQKKYLPLLAICLGVSNQAAIFTVFLFGSLLVGYLFAMQKRKRIWLFSVKEIFTAGLVYIISISTMILTELLMIKRGVLTLDILNKTGEHFVEGVELSILVLRQYYNFLLRLLSPLDILLFFLPLFCILIYGLMSLPKSLRWYFLNCAGSILWLLTWHFRPSLHLFIGIDVIVYILLAVGLWQLTKLFKGKTLLGILLALFVVMNLLTLVSAKNNRLHMFGIQRGTLLSEQVAAIEKTYEVAQGNEFSVSTLTAPYGVNVTWAYLYQQYGLKKYGYLPKFFGPTQRGWVGENVLAETNQASKLHFTIIEPDVYLGRGTAEKFLNDQTALSSPALNRFTFGTLIVEQRQHIETGNQQKKYEIFYTAP